MASRTTYLNEDALSCDNIVLIGAARYGSFQCLKVENHIQDGLVADLRIDCQSHMSVKRFISRRYSYVLIVGLSRLLMEIIRRTFLPEPSNISSRSEEHTSELQSRENLVCRL